MTNLNVDKLPPFNLSEPPTNTVSDSGSPIKGLVAPLNEGCTFRFSSVRQAHREKKVRLGIKNAPYEGFFLLFQCYGFE